jgi:hypothetical protein
MAGKLPFYKFFVDDWLADMHLRVCSPAARGLMIDLICLAHKSDRRGFIQQANTTPLTQEQVARLLGYPSAEAGNLFHELFNAGAISASETGVLFIPAMVREERIRKARSEAGSRPKNRDPQSGVFVPTKREQNRQQEANKNSNKPLDSECLDSGVLDSGVLEGGSPRGETARADPPGPGPPTPEDFQHAWNETIRFARFGTWTAERLALFAERCRDPTWLASWRAALTKIPESAFLCGECTDFKANIDWFLKSDSVTKIIEGNYEHGSTRRGGGNAPRQDGGQSANPPGGAGNPGLRSQHAGRAERIDIPVRSGSGAGEDANHPGANGRP